MPDIGFLASFQYIRSGRLTVLLNNCIFINRKINCSFTFFEPESARNINVFDTTYNQECAPFDFINKAADWFNFFRILCRLFCCAAGCQDQGD